MAGRNVFKFAPALTKVLKSVYIVQDTEAQ